MMSLCYNNIPRQLLFVGFNTCCIVLLLFLSGNVQNVVLVAAIDVKQEQQQQQQQQTFYPALLSSEQQQPLGYRQNLCDRQTGYALGQYDLRDALNGLQIRPIIGATVEELFKPITQEVSVEGGEGEGEEEETYYVDEFGIEHNEKQRTEMKLGYNPTNPGTLITMLDELSKRANFTWKESYAITGLPQNGTSWDQMIDWMVDTYDIAIEMVAILPHRMEMGLNFPAGFIDLSVIMVGLSDDPNDEGKFSFFNFLAPFDYDVWMMIVITMIVSSCIQWVLENEHLPQEERSKRPQTRNLFYTSIAFTGNFEPSQVTKNPSMLYQFSISFWACLVLSAYTANLASFFVIKNVPTLQVDTIEEAMQLQVPVCLYANAATDILLTSQFSTNNKNLIRKPSIPEAYEGLLSGECMVVATEAITWNTVRGTEDLNGNCRLKQIGRVYRFIQGGFATKADHGTLCTSIIRDVINIHIMDMIADGTLKTILHENLYFNEVDCDAVLARQLEEAELQGDTQQLDLMAMGGTFALHGILCGVALLLALSNRLTKKNRWMMHNNNKKNDDEDGVVTHEDLEDDEAITTDNGRQQLQKSSNKDLAEQIVELHMEMKSELLNEMKMLSSRVEEQNKEIADLKTSMAIRGL